MAKKQEISEDTKTLITVLLLVFAYPVGLIMMFVWTGWPKWVKTLIVLPLVLGIIFSFLIGGVIFSAIMNRSGEMKNIEYNYSVSTDQGSLLDEYTADQ